MGGRVRGFREAEEIGGKSNDNIRSENDFVTVNHDDGIDPLF